MIPHLVEPDSEIETLRQRIAALEDQVFGRLDVNLTLPHVPINFGAPCSPFPPIEPTSRDAGFPYSVTYCGGYGGPPQFCFDR